MRIPIGYWAFQVGPGEPYISGQLPYLQKAIGWAGTYGLKVIVDLHGAPGSQNGCVLSLQFPQSQLNPPRFDNSGQRLSFPGWHSNSTNVQRTDQIITQIASMFAGQTNVVSAIGALNEPAGFNGSAVLNVVRQFWYDSYGNTRYPYLPSSSAEGNALLIIHDAFQPLSYWDGFMPPPQYQGVMLDTHIYQVFSQADVQMSQSAHIQQACSVGGQLESFTSLWVVVGEWAPAITDCAEYLNGRGIGSRYAGTYSGSTKVGSCTGLSGPASSFSASYKTFLRQYWEAQVHPISFHHNHSFTNRFPGNILRERCRLDPMALERQRHGRRMVLPSRPR